MGLQSLYPPTAFNGLVGFFDSKDTSTLFDATSGGSLPAYGGQIARWENKASANHATQSTAGSRPIRSTAPIVGVRQTLDRVNDFSNAYWVKAGSTVNLEPSITPPLSDVDTWRLVSNVSFPVGDVSAARVAINTNQPETTTSLRSVYVKQGNTSHVALTTLGSAFSNFRVAFFNFNTKTMSQSGGLTSFSFEELPDGWFKIWQLSNSVGGGDTGRRFGVNVCRSNDVRQVDIGDFVYFAAPQHEDKSSPPSPFQHRITQHEVYEAGVPNRDYLDWNGTSHHMLVPASVFATVKTVIAVVEIQRKAGFQRMWMIPISDASNGSFLTQVIGSTATTYGHLIQLGISGTQRARLFSPTFPSDLHLISGVLRNDLSDVDGWINGSSYNKVSLDSNTATTTATNAILGARGRGDGTTLSEYAQMKLSALLIFNKALTNADRKRVEAWASNYYSVANIPAPQGIAAVPSVQLYVDFSRPETLFNATAGGSLVAPDGAIARAEDLSGNDFHATQGTSGNRPVRKVSVLNGRDVGRFDGSNDFLDLGTQLATTKPANWTVIGVAVTDNVNLPQSIIASGNAATNNHSYWGNLGVRGYDNGRVDSSVGDGTNGTWRNTTDVVMNNNEWGIFSARYATGSNNINIYKNGVSKPTTIKAGGTNTTSAGTAFEMKIGRLGEFNGYYWRRDISTVIVADTALDAMTFNSIMEILGEQFGLDAPFMPERKNVVLSYPDLPLKASYVETSNTWNTLKRHYNLFRGKRYHYAELASSSSSDRVFTFTANDWDLREVDHFTIARADLLLASGDINLKLEFSNNKTLWQTVWIDTLTAEKLTGIRNQDYITDVFNFGARKYWRFTISGGTGVRPFSKLYIGKAYDFGVNPHDFSTNVETPSLRPFIADSGARYLMQGSAPHRTFRLTYEGVPDSYSEEFMKEIAMIQANRAGVFVLNPVQTQILADKKLVHCEIVDFQRIENVGFPNWNTIIINLKEMLG